MEDIEKKRLLEEMDRRTALWGGMRDDAKSRLKTGTGKAIAKIDLRVAEDALKRIEARKNEIVGKTVRGKSTEPFRTRDKDRYPPVIISKTKEEKKT
jgi:hypothetical protein